MTSHIELEFAKFVDETMRRTEVVVTKALAVAGGYAAEFTPMATSFLLNSQYRQVEITANGIRGEIGYGAHYAGYVHDAPGTLIGTNTPRYPKSDGVVWGPNAKPGFLEDGVQEMLRSDLDRLVAEDLFV